MLCIFENWFVFELASQCLKLLLSLFFLLHFIFKVRVVYYFIDLIAIHSFSTKSLIFRNWHFWRKTRFILKQSSWNDSRTNIRSELRLTRAIWSKIYFWNWGVGIEINPVFFRKLHKLVKAYLSIVIYINVFENFSDVIVGKFYTYTFKSISEFIVTYKTSILSIKIPKSFLQFLKLFFNFSPNYIK